MSKPMAMANKARGGEFMISIFVDLEAGALKNLGEWSEFHLIIGK